MHGRTKHCSWLCGLDPCSVLLQMTPATTPGSLQGLSPNPPGFPELTGRCFPDSKLFFLFLRQDLATWIRLTLNSAQAAWMCLSLQCLDYREASPHPATLLACCLHSPNAKKAQSASDLAQSRGPALAHQPHTGLEGQISLHTTYTCPKLSMTTTAQTSVSSCTYPGCPAEHLTGTASWPRVSRGSSRTGAGPAAPGT